MHYILYILAICISALVSAIVTRVRIDIRDKKNTAGVIELSGEDYWVDQRSCKFFLTIPMQDLPKKKKVTFIVRNINIPYDGN